MKTSLQKYTVICSHRLNSNKLIIKSMYAAQPVTKISVEAEKNLCPSKGHCMQYIPFSQMALIKTM